MRTARQRCWRYDWVLDLDIQGFFDGLGQRLFEDYSTQTGMFENGQPIGVQGVQAGLNRARQ